MLQIKCKSTSGVGLRTASERRLGQKLSVYMAKQLIDRCHMHDICCREFLGK